MGTIAGAGVSTYGPYGVAVLTLRGDRIEEIDTFRDPAAPDRFGLPRQA